MTQTGPKRMFRGGQTEFGAIGIFNCAIPIVRSRQLTPALTTNVFRSLVHSEACNPGSILPRSWTGPSAILYMHPTVRQTG